MSGTSCINGHGMWDGDGTPSVEAYRINFFRDLMRKEPDCVIHHYTSSKYSYIYDCFDNNPEEEFDIWYCDECGTIIVFAERWNERYDYVPCAIQSLMHDMDYSTWEEYIAFRDISDDFEAFHDYCEGRSPLDALLTYGFKDRYYLSPNKEYIIRIEKKKGITDIFKLARYIDFSKEPKDDKDE